MYTKYCSTVVNMCMILFNYLVLSYRSTVYKYEQLNSFWLSFTKQINAADFAWKALMPGLEAFQMRSSWTLSL